MAEQKRTYTVLICERDKEVVEQMKQALASVEWQIVGVAASEDEAVELAQQHKPDIIVMALTLEVEQDGLAATRRILTEQQTAIVVISTSVEKAVFKAALEAAACGFLVKPLNTAKFAIALLLARSRFEALRYAVASASRLEVVATSDDGHEEMFGFIRNALEVKADATRPKTKKRTEFIH